MSAKADEKTMGWLDLLDFKRAEIGALHKTWIAFFITFYVWFNMAPLVSTIIKDTGLTLDQLKVLAICNVALTVPARVIVGMICDRIGPRKTFCLVLWTMAFPCIWFAFASTYTEMLISRLILGTVGTGFVVGIAMTSLWFKPRDAGFSQGVEAGLGNWGSSVAAITLPFIALSLLDSWRWSIAISGLVMFAYGTYYWFAITDGPVGTKRPIGRKAQAIEVSTWGDLVIAICWTIPVFGVLSLLVRTVTSKGYISADVSYILYAAVLIGVLYQVVALLKVNLPILRKGVPEDDKYRFTQVGTLCASYVVTFGAELAIISMLPFFFQKTFQLSPVMAGLFGSLFAVLNFFSRALGGYVSDRTPTRKLAHLIYLAGVTAGFVLMGMIGPQWPLAMAVLVVMFCAMFVTGGCGTTFALVPFVKRRITGNVAGYTGAYGNVGAVIYTTAYTFLTDSQFFLLIGGTAGLAFVFCLFFMNEPTGAFAKEYHLSSVDQKMMAVGGH
ncbi:Nitrate/nitrite transporter [Georgfuchsia toluolica]|uniref:Nitrate/nitrite transporter n=1 Tax=Georgfuchsia toluolica TaxID=424218 RepID=A0A916N0W0_9PROT|nr:MFS transporter [Georgfuchsia toluolica]CAG4884318.1 Nitrate/nitrite transporter [Georgfuchsia toluolica]